MTLLLGVLLVLLLLTLLSEERVALLLHLVHVLLVRCEHVCPLTAKRGQLLSWVAAAAVVSYHSVWPYLVRTMRLHRTLACLYLALVDHGASARAILLDQGVTGRHESRGVDSRRNRDLGQQLLQLDGRGLLLIARVLFCHLYNK